MASASGAAAAPPKRVVVCGGGIIGASTAYYLSTAKALPVTLVERHEVAGAASGKAGGFLALDWNDRSPVGRLARKSFQLHKDLAAAFGADAIGYRPVDTLSVAAAAPALAAKKRRRPPAAGVGGLPGWLDGEGVLESSAIGTTATTAQVHPQKLTRALWAAAEAAGSRLVEGAVEGLVIEGGAVTGVRVAGAGVLPADAVVLAMGPWTGAASEWLHRLPGVGGQKAHSVVLRPAASAADEGGGGGGGGGVTAHAVFLAYKDAAGKAREPEIYPRPDGTVYVCGETTATPLPEDPADVGIDGPACIERIREAAGDVASCLSGAEAVAEQACYLPITADGLPLIGRVPGVRNVFVGSGHSCWGILNGPATGLALAELIADGAVASVDLKPFDPDRGGHEFGAV